SVARRVSSRFKGMSGGQRTLQHRNCNACHSERSRTSSGQILRCLQPSHKATAWQATSLDMTETDIRSQTAAVIPAYQDEKHIGDIVRRTRERLDHILVIDDGSSDQTAHRAREAGAEVLIHDQ